MGMRIILTTITRDKAEGFARDLVENSLAACVNIIDIHSVYRWKGKVYSEDESLLVIKVSDEAFEKTYEYILKNHPYELPELVVIGPEKVFEEYLAWVKESCETD